MKDYYKVLGVKPSASNKEIKNAYRRLAKYYHPDQSKHKNATIRFISIHEAYSILSDLNKRVEYDRLYNYEPPKASQPENVDTNRTEFDAWVRYARQEGKGLSEKPLNEILTFLGSTAMATVGIGLNVWFKIIIFWFATVAFFGGFTIGFGGIILIPLGALCYWFLFEQIIKTQSNGLSIKKLLKWLISHERNY